MKRFSLLILFIACLPFYLFCQSESITQDCALITRTISDDLSGRERLIANEEIRVNDLLSGDLFQIVLTKTEETLSIIIRAVNKACFLADTPISFYFRDGSSLEFKSQNKENCESLILVNMSSVYSKEDQYDFLLNHFLVGIKFESSSGIKHRLKIETPHTELIQELFECLIVSE